MSHIYIDIFQCLAWSCMSIIWLYILFCAKSLPKFNDLSKNLYYRMLEWFSSLLSMTRNDLSNCLDKEFWPEFFPMASELRYHSLTPNISAQRLWERILARTLCQGSLKDHFVSLKASLKITLASCSKDSLINHWIWAVILHKIRCRIK